tara:strand:+ start:4648 stop:5520 length:873 start_codon:yes stop_codon:yes gene_type:complete
MLDELTFKLIILVVGYLVLGFTTGTYGVLIGAGGGFILAPVLILFFNLDPYVAVGTSLALVTINSFSGAWAYHRKHMIDYRSGIISGLLSIPGAVIAPIFLQTVPQDIFKILFGVLLVSLSIYMFLRKNLNDLPTHNAIENSVLELRFIKSRYINTQNNEKYVYQVHELGLGIVNVFLGFVSSFFGTGGGFLRTPILVYGFHFPIKIAVATSIFSLCIYTTLGSITYAYLGNIQFFPTLVCAGAGLMVGGQVGAWISQKIQGVWILRLLLVVVLILGIQLFLEGFKINII